MGFSIIVEHVSSADDLERTVLLRGILVEQI
jgi:hypothetical protein